MGQTVRWLLIGVCAWVLLFGLSLELGTGALSLDAILQLRLPRVLLATAVGAGLAMAGMTLQSLFCNALCEPYTLGVSSGAAVGAVFASTLGIASGAGMTLSAVLGALAFSAILAGVAIWGQVRAHSLLLVGVMLGLLGSSLVALWMALADPAGIQSALFWLLGDLSRGNLHEAIAALVICATLGVTLFLRSGTLDALLLGAEGAQSLGVPVKKTQARLIFISSMLVATCVGTSGMIGFVGLVLPHWARSRVGALHKRALPIAALWGANCLLASDLLCSLVFSPHEIPVGVVSAIWGAPLFVWILLKRRTAGSFA